MESIIKKASKALGFVIRNAKEFRNVKTKIILYNTFVRSILEYCSVVWRPHYAVHTLRIERIQKRFLWHLSFSARRTKKEQSYNARMQYFKILSLDRRRKLLDALFLHKIVTNKTDCPQILGCVRFYAPARMPRNKISPFCPPLRATVLGRNSPISRMTKIVNTCSDHIDIHNDSMSKIYKTILVHLDAI